MAPIFPGMDPYLEEPNIWPGFHQRMVVYLADYLQPRLGSRYIVAVEERVYVEGPRPREIIPDVWLKRDQPKGAPRQAALLDADSPVVVQLPEVEVHESYVQIFDRSAGENVVTVIELVSPSNKHPGAGRDSYIAKQREVLASRSHLVEIDLLRGGTHVCAVPEWLARAQGAYCSLVCVNRGGGLRDTFELYARLLQERLPRIRIPLANEDPDVALDLQAVLAQTYDAGRYGARLSYATPCRPPLAATDQQWADLLIGQATSPSDN